MEAPPPQIEISKDDFSELLANRVFRSAYGDLKKVIYVVSGIVVAVLAVAGMDYKHTIDDFKARLTEQQQQLEAKTKEAVAILSEAKEEKLRTDEVLQNAKTTLNGVSGTIPVLEHQQRSVTDAVMNVMTKDARDSATELAKLERQIEKSKDLDAQLVKDKDESEKVIKELKAQSDQDRRELATLSASLSSLITPIESQTRTLSQSGTFVFADGIKQTVRLMGSGGPVQFSFRPSGMLHGDVRKIEIDGADSKAICRLADVHEGDGFSFADRDNVYDVFVRSTVGIGTSTSRKEFALFEVRWDVNSSKQSRTCRREAASGIYAVRE